MAKKKDNKRTSHVFAVSGVHTQIPNEDRSRWSLEYFKGLSVLNQLMVLSAIAAIVSIFITLFIYWFPRNANTEATARLTSISTLMSDLEKVDSLLPFDRVLSDCILKRNEPFAIAIETCVYDRRLNNRDPETIIENDYAALQLHLTRQERQAVEENLNLVMFFIHEMWSNQFVYEYWQKTGCPTGISRIGPGDWVRYLAERKGEARCAITFKEYGKYFERQDRSPNKNYVREANYYTHVSDGIAYAIVPGNETTIHNHMSEINNWQFWWMLQEKNKLKLTLARLGDHSQATEKLLSDINLPYEKRPPAVAYPAGHPYVYQKKEWVDVPDTR